MWLKKANDFQIAEVQPQSVAYLLLNFLTIAYKSVAYKKRVYSVKNCLLKYTALNTNNKTTISLL